MENEEDLWRHVHPRSGPDAGIALSCRNRYKPMDTESRARATRLRQVGPSPTGGRNHGVVVLPED